MPDMTTALFSVRRFNLFPFHALIGNTLSIDRQLCYLVNCSHHIASSYSGIQLQVSVAGLTIVQLYTRNNSKACFRE